MAVGDVHHDNAKDPTVGQEFGERLVGWVAAHSYWSDFCVDRAWSETIDAERCDGREDPADVSMGHEVAGLCFEGGILPVAWWCVDRECVLLLGCQQCAGI